MPIDKEVGAISNEPRFASIFEALDNTESRMHFFKMLGFEPVYNDKGFLVAWKEREEETTWKELLMSTLAQISSKKVMGIANMSEVDPLDELEVELRVELVLELIDLLTPPDADILRYLPAIEWAKLEMKKGMTLAGNGMLVKSLMGVPIVPEEEPKPTIVNPEENRGLLAKLLGGK